MKTGIDAPPTSVPVVSSAFQRPHLGLLSCEGKANGVDVNILYDDGALMSFASTSLTKRLAVENSESPEAACMPDGRVHNLRSTTGPYENSTNSCEDQI